MTLWLARRVEHGEVDETSTTYIGLCDDDGCRHMVDHRDEQIVADALDGHRRRAHVDTEALRGGWLTFTGPGPGIVRGPINVTPSPTPREETP